MVLAGITFFGFFGLCSGFWVWRGLRSLSWPTTECEILEKNIVETGAIYHVWYPAVKYRFSVHGEEFDGGRLRFYPVMYSNPKAAERAIEHFIYGKPTRVSYHPRNPNLSVLIPGPTLFSIAAFVGGAAILAAVMAHALGVIKIV